MQIDGSTRLVGVFGDPVRHTASPAMHNAAFAALQMNWAYLAFPVAVSVLKTALHGARDMGLVGVNLTVPHKLAAVEMMDVLDDEAAQLGAVNTVCFRNGQLHGFNTDGYGLIRSLQEDFNLEVAGKKVLVLGAGGAGRGIAIKLARSGAASVDVANRTVSKIDPILTELEKLKVAGRAWPLETEALAPVMEEIDLVINATSVGLEEAQASPLAGELFSPRHYLYDAVYRPARTALIEAAAARGARTSNGLGMLLHQGARAFELWTEAKAPLTVMRRALRSAVYGESS